MNSLHEISKAIDAAIVKRKLLRSEVGEIDAAIASAQSDIEVDTSVKNILVITVQATQKQVSGFIEKVGTLALKSVFKGDDYRFVVDYKTRRDGRVDVHLLVKENDDDEPYDPKDEEGGGLVDILSFTLRPVMLRLMGKKSRNVLLLDEPFRFTGDYTELAGKMLKEVSAKLGIQVIMITHSREMVGVADRCWDVLREKGQSTVRLSRS